MMKTQNRLRTATAVVVALLVSAASNGLAQTDQVAFRSADGDSVTLAENRGKVMVLVFSATWVPVTNKSLPALQRLADVYQQRGAIFYWVSLNNARAGSKHYASDADLKGFAEKNGWRLEILRDPQMKAFKGFGLDALPSVVIIDRNGQVYRKYVGFDNGQAQGYRFLMKPLNRLLK
ncbi:MAG TPA: TlpA disulfide reductase family protein [Blastocatellia bacterium]|nr:TlpA disulfide reductase family protein [Blastocatellia bacterium]